MLFYYIDTIEQVKATEESPYTINEYGNRAVQKNKDGTAMCFNEVYSKYCEKQKNVSSDLIEDDPEKNNHYYMDIKIINSDGGIVERKQLGKRQEVEFKPEPNEEES